jgi:hypothetical protein
MIEYVTQYSGNVGSFQFILEKKGLVYSSYFKSGNRVARVWSVSFSRMKLRSTGFLLELKY